MSTVSIWVIPTMTYLLQKMIGVQFNQYEFIWWIIIPTMFVVWFMLNFKITK
jgi:hypothetical protein